MVDWSGYSDGGESSRRPPTRWWNPMDWRRNDDLGDEEEEENKSWLNDRRVQIVVIIIFILGIALIIAGSIMVGIGISKSNKACPFCPSVSSSPFYATVESTQVTYQDVLSNYSHAANIVANQVRSALTGSATSKASFAATSQNTDPFITVLGLSSSPSGSVMAVVGMGYTTADSPGATTILNHLDTAPKLNLYHMAESAASSPDTQMCNAVSTYSQNTQTNAITSTSSSSTQTTTAVTPEATTTVQTSSTSPQTVPSSTSTVSSPASSSPTVTTSTSVMASSSSSPSSSSRSTTTKPVTLASTSAAASSSSLSSASSSTTAVPTTSVSSSVASSSVTTATSASSSTTVSTSLGTSSSPAGSSSISSTVTSSPASSTSLNPTSTSSPGTTSSTTRSSTNPATTSTVAPSSTIASSSSTTVTQTSPPSSTSASTMSTSTAGLSTTSANQPNSTTNTVPSSSTTVPLPSTTKTSASTMQSSSANSAPTSTVTQTASVTSTTPTYLSSSTSEAPTTCSCPPVTECASPSTTASSTMVSATNTPTMAATSTTASQSSSASTQSTAFMSTSSVLSSSSSVASTSASPSSTATPKVTTSTNLPSSSTLTSTSPQITSTVETTSSTGMSSSSSTDSTFTSTSTIASSTAPTSPISSTIASSSVPVSSTVSSPASTTTPSCVWPTSTPTVPNRTGARDIVVLIDDSTAVGNFSNYDQIVSWLSHQLFPLWPISSDRWEAAPAQYAEHEYNLLMDFDANSADELSKAVSGSTYSGRNAPSVTKAFKSTLGLAGREGVKRFLLVISASSNLTDIENALSLAEMTKENGADVITLALGGADDGTLGILSSGSGYAFSSDSFVLTAEQAVAITDLVQGQETTVRSTTIASTTTTESQKDLPCHPDVAVVIDTSSAVSSAEEFNRQLSFISSQLSPSWSISPSGMEAELVIFSSAYGGLLGKGAFTYQNSNEFSEVVGNSYFYFNDFAAPNISGSLQYLASTENNRRPTRTATTILITYSGGYSDVAAVQASLSSLGNLVVVSMGNDPTYLYSLSGDVISGMDYGDDMKDQINSLLCQPSTRIPLTSTVASSSSSASTTTVMKTTTSLQSTSTVTPLGCEDCYPAEANVLIVMDASSLMKGGKLDQLKAFINNDLTSQWNHPERLALLTFDDKTHFDAPMDFDDFNSLSEFHQLVSSAPQLPNPPYLPSAFQRALSNFNPLPSFGQMNTVIFTISFNGVDSIGDYANQLSMKGTVVIVGMEMTNTSSLTSLSQNIVSWPDLKDSAGISDQIEQYLSPGLTPGTTLSTVSTSTVTGTTSGVTSSSSTDSTVIVTSPIPAACGRDVILMIDESNAFTDVDSFQKVQSWLVTSLIPQWNISPSQISVAPFGFANKTWDDLGGDFLVNSAAELETIISNNLVYRPKTPPSLTSGLRKAVAVNPPRQGAATVIISASDASGDVDGAISYSEKLKEDGRVVITLAVGPNTNGHLNKLSSGDGFSFTSPSFDIPASIAKEISDVLCSSAPTESTTIGTSTPGSTSTSPPSSPFSCNPDIAFLFDNSAVNSNASQFADLLLYTANSLISDWIVHPGATEAGISYANAKAGSFAQNPWTYNSRDELKEALIATKGEFYGGDASITNLIKSSIGMLTQSRVTQPLNVVIFTFSSDYDDVVEAVPLRNILNANFVAVGLGDSDPDILALLTGNVITGLGLGDDLTKAIDKAICTNSPPVKVPTTSTSSTSTTSSSSSIVTTTAASTTEPVPIGCSDCYPSMANLLILMDISNDQSNSTFNYQKEAVNSLVTSWTHFERVALSSFASTLQNLISYNDLANNELSTLTKTVNSLEHTTMTADLGKSLHQATGIIPDSDYGEQKTILFTATASVSGKAKTAAAELRNKGQLIVIAVDMTDPGVLEGLASPGDAIPWSNVKDTQFIVDSIMAALGVSSPPTPEPGGTSTSSPATTVSQSSTETSSPPVLCSQNFLLLMDESNAIPSAAEFNQLKNWVVSTLLPGLPSTSVAPYGYADKDWNPITGGEFIADMISVEMLTNVSYTYKAQDGPNIAKALKIAASLEVEGSLTTLIISASADPDDVAKSAPFAETLKQEGAVVTLMIGTGDLSSLASDSSLALTSNCFSPDDSIVKKIASAMCTPYTPTNVATTTASSSTVTSTMSSSTTVTTASSSLSSTSTAEPTSTSASSSTVTTTSAATTPFVPDDSYNPAMADIVIVFDVSLAVNTSSLEAQKDLINTLVINWNHFERVAIMDFASQPNAVAEFEDLASANDLNEYLQAVYQMNTAGDLASCLKFAKKHYPVESGMPGRNVLLLTASEDTAGAAQPAAQALQGDGSIVVVSLAMADNSALSSIASPGSLVSFNDFSNTEGVADQINQLLGESNSTAAPGTASSTVSSSMTTTSGVTTSQPSLCSQNFLLLMDESNAIPSPAEFNQLKNWVTSSLLPGLPSTAVAPYGYADKDWNPITGGEFLDDMAAVEMLTNLSYTYKAQDGANIAKALKIAASLEVEGSLTTLIISASADPDDVAKSAPFAETLKQEGAVVTLMIGTGDLSSLASDSSLALTSNSFSPDDSIVKKIASAMCTPYTPTSVATTTVSSTTATSTMSSSSTVTTASSSSSPTITSVPTSTSASSSTVTTTSAATTPFVPDDTYNPAMADIVIVFDVSSAVNTSSLEAQKDLINTLIVNWNHFERVAIMDFASQPNSVAEFGDLNSPNDLSAYLQAVYQMNTAGDLALWVLKHYPVESGMPGRNVLLLTASEDTAGAAQPAAQALQGDGSIVVVSLAMADNSALSSLASPGSLVSFNDFSNTEGVADQINQLLGESNSTGTPGTSSSTSTAVPSTTIGVTTSQPSLCSQNFLLLMDESNAIPSPAEFNQLKNWVTSSLLPGLPSTSVAPYGYADKDWNPITGGEFIADMISVEMLTNFSYTYKAQDGPNIAKALKIAASLEVEDSLTTLIISASADPDDVAKSASFAETLKQEGAVVTLMIGTGDLSSLASDSSLALTSNSFSPDDSIVKKIASAMCTPYTPTSVATTTASSSTVTSTMSASTSTLVASSTSSPTPTTVRTSTIELTTMTSPGTTSTLTPDASFSPAMADVVLIFDVSSSVNDTSLTAQRNLINTLVTNWNHFERVGIMFFASQPDHLADFGDLASANDLNAYLQALNLMNSAADLSSALKFAKKYYGIEPGMPGRNVVLMTASEDTAGAAQPAAQALQGEGRVVVVSLGLSDNSELTSIASPEALVAFNDFSALDGVADQVNQLLGEHSTGSSTSSYVPSTTSSGVTTTTPGSLCSQNFLLLMDESNAFPSIDNFSELKNWVINTLLPSISAPTAVAPYGYADKEWNPITGGEFIADMISVEMLTNISYTYKPQNGPNIAKALQIAASLDVEGSLTTLVISASADPNDVTKAIPYSNSLKEEGNLITLMLGNGDLSSLASAPALAFNSIGYTPDDFTTAKILSFLCNPLSLPPTSSTSTSTAAATSTSTQTTSTTASPSTSTVFPSSTSSSTLTSSSSTTTTPEPTTTITPDSSFSPAMADVVLIFDVSSSVNDTSLTAQKNLINTLVTNWNHFERVGIMFFASQPDHLADFGDLASANDLNAYLQALNLINTAADLSSALKFVKKYYGIEPGMPARNVVLMTASEDTAGAAQPAAQALQGEGRVVVVSLGISDNSELTSIASPGALVAFNDFSAVDGVADQVNQLLGSNTPTLSISSSSTTQSGPATSTVIGSSNPQPKICTKNLLLLLDESNALPSVLEFAQLRSWLVSTLLPSLPTIAVGPFGYANKDWNPISGGRFLTDIPSLEELIQTKYDYLDNSGPNITSALQSSTRLAISGSVTTLLISASANPDDVTSAAPFAAYLKEGGPVVTLKLGDTGDLSSLASAPSFALTSSSFTPDATVVSQIISAICSTPSTTNSPSTTTTSSGSESSTAAASTTVSTEAAPLASSTTSMAGACSKNLLLLLDESNALPGPLEFAQLRSWLASTLLPSLPAIAVGPFGYADKDWNPITQGRFLTDMPSAEELIRNNYNYLPDSGPNITSALQSSTRLVISGSVTTLLISASANRDDVTSAAPFAAYLKEGGPVVTLKFGDAGDLSSLASDPSFALSSTTFTPDASIVSQIVSAICSLPANN